MNFFLRTVSTLIFISISLLSQSSFTYDDWQHIPLRSQDGTSMLIDFQFINGSYEPHHQQLNHYVNNLWINAYTDNQGILTENCNIKAVFRILRNQKKSNSSENWTLESTINVSLNWNGQNFTGQLKGFDQLGNITTIFPIYSIGAFGEYEYRQEISFYVSKNDEQFLLIDPINHTSNFKIDLYKQTLEQKKNGNFSCLVEKL